MFTIPLSIEYKKVLSALQEKTILLPNNKVRKNNQTSRRVRYIKGTKTLICNDGMEMLFFIV